MTVEQELTMPRVSHLRAQFNRAHISAKDFQDAHGYLKHLSQADSDLIRSALLTSAVVAFARPFTQNERGAAKSNATPSVSSAILRGLLPQELELHARVLYLRHQAVAHSSFSTRPLTQLTVWEHGFGVESVPFDILNEQLDVDLFCSLNHKLLVTCHLVKNELIGLMRGGVNAPDP